MLHRCIPAERESLLRRPLQRHYRMKLALLAASCVLASLIAACTIAKQALPNAIGVIELIVTDEQGWPLPHVAIWVEGEVFALETGGMALTVSGPVWVVASKPGYATSQPTLLLPGHREITLHALARVN
jgi:hypothetical protein